MANPLEPGIHLLHKPAGPTSFALLQTIKTGRLRCCHGGTLDPFASGLLLVLVQPATQLFDLLHDVPKVYDVTIRWGVETDNGDPTGTAIRQVDRDLAPEKIAAAMQAQIGWHDQIPPPTSNKRIGGERAYKLAHRGEEVNLPATSVYLHSVEWIQHDLPRTSRVRLTVRGGFYVRALIRDLGRELESAAHVDSLQRVAIGPYTDPTPGQIVHAPAMPWLPTRHLSTHEVNELKNGRPIDVDRIDPPMWNLPPNFPHRTLYVRAMLGDRFIFILEQQAGRLNPNRLLRGGLGF